MNPYESLANAIIIQAAQDYRTALKTLTHDSENIRARIMVTEIESFLNSQWYMQLSDIPGDYLMYRLQREVYAL